MSVISSLSPCQSQSSFSHSSSTSPSLLNHNNTANMSFFKRFSRSHNQNSNSPATSSPAGPRLIKRLSMMASPSSSSSGVKPSTNPFSNPSPSTRRPNNAPADPPPAYSPPTTNSATPADNPYSFLSTFDTMFLIDDSGSMAGRSWRETSAAIAAITPICTAHDTNGIDVYFLNHPDNSEYHNITRAEDVQRIFTSVRPYGGTPTGSRLNAILRPYLRTLKDKGPDAVKPLNIIVITDGVPSDDVESVVLRAAKVLEECDAPAWQVGIQFFQVGNERGAAEALKELDDGLVEMGCKRDIVDTVPWNPKNHSSGDQLNADGILKVVLGAVNRRLDRKRNSADGLRG